MWEWHMEAACGLDAQDRLRQVYSRPAIEQEWATERRAMALVLWRAALDHDVLVDDAVLADAGTYLTLSKSGMAAVTAQPLPEDVHRAAPPDNRVMDPDGTGQVVRAMSPEFMSRLAALLLPHTSADVADFRSAPSRIGPLRTVGYRVRELRSTPGWIKGDWPDMIKDTRADMATARDQLQSGQWQVSPGDLAAGRAVGLGQPVYDYPPAPAGALPSWLQQAFYLLHLADTLRTVAATVPRAADSKPAPLAMVLTSAAATFGHLQESTREIERLWAAEPELPPDPMHWDLTHVPITLRRETDGLAQLSRALTEWLDALPSESR